MKNAKRPTMRIYKRCFIITLETTIARAKCYIPKTGTYSNTDEKADPVVTDFCDHGLAG
jgi:hypothetical protein